MWSMMIVWAPKGWKPLDWHGQDSALPAHLAASPLALPVRLELSSRAGAGLSDSRGAVQSQSPQEREACSGPILLCLEGAWQGLETEELPFPASPSQVEPGNAPPAGDMVEAYKRMRGTHRVDRSCTAPHI